MEQKLGESVIDPKKHLTNPTTEWTVQQIVEACFLNQDQKGGEFRDRYYKKYDTLESLIATLPKVGVNAVNQFLSKHSLLPSDVFPSKKGILDTDAFVRSCTFIGPYVGEEWFFVITELTNKRIARLQWSEDGSIELIFQDKNNNTYYWVCHKPSEEQTVYLYDSHLLTNLHSYEIDQEGNITNKII